MIVSLPLHMHLSFAAAVGLFWTSVACCAFAQFFILRSVGGRRHVPEPTAHLPRQRGGMEALWAVVPAVALAVLLAFTWRAIRSAPADVQRAASARGGVSGVSALQAVR
jgi:heme/copper-type cytochrome/quinol oxidase subunit 2